MQKISIITINLNQAEGLQKTIESVANQSYNNIEYIVIDGASTDGSIDIIKRNIDIFFYWISEPDSGIYNAMNKGIRKATGEYLLFLNSGDYLYSDSIIEDVFNENQNADLIYGNQYRIGNKSRLVTFPEELSFYHFYTEYLGHNSTFIKRELFDRVGLYNENYKIVSDHEFFILAVCKFNCSTSNINKTVSVMLDGGISNNILYRELGITERENILKEHFPTFISDYKELYNYKFNSLFKRFKRFVKYVIRRF